MVKKLKRIFSLQHGQVLPMALVLMMLGGFLVTPLLDLMSTSLKYNRVIMENDIRYYDADAGIHKMLWHIWQHNIPLPEEDEELRLSDYDSNFQPPNGSTVEVTLTLASGGARPVYKLVSVATSPDNRSTEIECYLSGGVDYSSLFERAMSTPGTVYIPTCSEKTVIYGGVCGGFPSSEECQEAVRSGEIDTDCEPILPTKEELDAFYAHAKNCPCCCDSPCNLPCDCCPTINCPTTPCPTNFCCDGEITVSGTKEDPTPIGPLYRYGDLTIEGSGYAKLMGTVYVDGRFRFTDKDVKLCLNGQTVYATYRQNPCGEPNQDTSAIYFGPDTTVIGPGCLIGIGNVNFQPNVGEQQWLLGHPEGDEPSTWNAVPANRLVLQKFEATKSGKLSNFQVRCLAPEDPENNPTKIKVALYKADGTDGGPGTLLTWDEAEVNLYEPAWFVINLEPEKRVDIQAGTKKNPVYYWMAAIADQAIISCEDRTTSGSKYRDFSSYDDFNPADPGDIEGLSDCSSPSNCYYFIRGYTETQDFILVMSLECEVNMQPGGNFYGAIVGNSKISLKKDTFINLVGVPEGGLDFPSMTEGYDLAGSQRIQSYRVK